MNISEYVFIANKEHRDALDEEIKTDYEEHIFSNVFCEYADHLPEKPFDQYGNKNPVWCDGSEILCESEILAKTIADMLEYITGECEYVRYHYYDPKDDERSGEVDDHTGWWCVDFD